MQISLSWLKEWVNCSWDPAVLGHRLTMAGFEVEGQTDVAGKFTQVVVGEVLSTAPHPDAAKLTVCQVDSGNGTLQIVCGASNVRAGLKAPLALVGAQLPGGVAIGAAKLRGVESQGMLCSAKELGMGEGADGLLELPASLTTGEDLRAALDLDDVILHLNLTPNRGDCLSLNGIAREVAVLCNGTVKEPRIATVAAASRDTLPVKLSAPAAAPKFVGRVIRGVDPSAVSPLWLQERLRRSGLRSISPVVDVTNFVMLELGQPLHAYDMRKLRGGIDVRLASDNETLTLLDGREITLSPDVLVIADEAGPVGLAGIMGGEKSGIAPDTTDVFLEVAWFAPAAIAGRARRYGLVTDASQRFERGVDPELQERVMERATQLLLEIAGGDAGPTIVTSESAHLPAHATVRLRPPRVTKVLGVSIGEAEIASILEQLGIQVLRHSGVLVAEAPSWRFDIRIEEDLIEEVARVYGYDNIPETDAMTPQVQAEVTEKQVVAERLLLLLVNRGYQEAITFSFVDPDLQQRLFPGVAALKLANPISSDLADMRVSLWPGLLKALGDNSRRQQSRVRLFELGRKFLIEESGNLVEVPSLAGVVTGSALPEQWGTKSEAVDFYDVKADVEALLAATGFASEFRFVADKLDCLHPGRTARIWRGEKAVGWLGQLHPEIAKALNLQPAPYLFDIDVEPSFISQIIEFKEISKFPVIRRDLAVVVPEAVNLASIHNSVTVSASGLLRELTIFDVYRGPGIETGRKSIALGLILQETSRTLTDADADAVLVAVSEQLRRDLNATIRE